MMKSLVIGHHKMVKIDLLKKKVKKILDQNHRIGNGYDYTCPSPSNYPHQWLWDSCFHAIVLTHFDLERSKSEIKTLLSNQRGDGFVPCVSIWKKRFPLEGIFYVNKITQPPVIPYSVEIVYKRTKDLIFVKEVYPKLKKFMDWLARDRDINKNNLVEIIHPWEAGCDSIPSFDGQRGIKNPQPSDMESFYSIFSLLARYQLMGWNESVIYKKNLFINECVLFNSIYAKSLASMVFLAEILNEKSDVATFKYRYKKTKEALLNLSWSKKDGIFYDLDDKGNQIRVKTVSSLMPLILNDLPKEVIERLVSKHLLNENEFWTRYPIPSVSRDEKSFNPGKNYTLWRGPIWININWFMSKALASYGYGKEAAELTQKTVEMIEKNSFWEFYNPLTGNGYGQPDLGWSTLVLDMVS